MDLIVAADRNWAIGNNGSLLCHLPGDLQYFKKKTTGKTVVMGRNTLESLPNKQGLPNRNNIVLTKKPDYRAENAVVVHNMEELRKELEKYNEEDIFVIGGAVIYKLLLDHCRQCFVTRIDAEFKADRWFTNLDKDTRFKKITEGETREENGIKYRFDIYQNVAAP